MSLTFDVVVLNELTARGWNQTLIAVHALYLPDRPPTATEIAREAKLDRRVVLVAIKDLVENGLIVQAGRGELKAYAPADAPSAPILPPDPSTKSDSENGKGEQDSSWIAESDNGNGIPIPSTLSESANGSCHGEQNPLTVSVHAPAAPPAPPPQSHARMRSSRDLKKNMECNSWDPEGGKSVRTPVRARRPPARLTIEEVRARADPELPPAIGELRDLILLARYRDDDIEESQVLKATLVAVWLHTCRQATPEKFGKWLSWWWHHPNSVGFQNQSQPYPANVRNTWDRAFPQIPEAPPALTVVPSATTLTPMQQEAAAYRLRVEARLREVAEQEERYVEAVEIRA